MFSFDDYMAMLEGTDNMDTSDNMDDTDLEKIDDTEMKDDSDDLVESSLSEAYEVEKALVAFEMMDIYCSEQYLMQGKDMTVTMEASIKGVWEKIKKFFKKIWGKIKAFFKKAKLYILSIFMDTEKFYEKYKSEIDTKLKNLDAMKLYVNDYVDYSKIDIKVWIDALKGMITDLDCDVKSMTEEEYNNNNEKWDEFYNKNAVVYEIDTNIIKAKQTLLTSKIFNEEYAFYKTKKDLYKSIEELEKKADDSIKKAKDAVDKIKSDTEDENLIRGAKFSIKTIKGLAKTISSAISHINKIIGARAKQFNSILRVVIRKTSNENNSAKKTATESYRNYYGDGNTEITIESIMRTF